MTEKGGDDDGIMSVVIALDSARPVNPPKSPAGTWPGETDAPPDGWPDNVRDFGPPTPEDKDGPGGPGGGGAGTGRRRGDGLPDDCPVTPLGRHGNTSFYLDAEKQLIPLKDKEHSRLGIAHLFGRHVDRLYTGWPKRNQDGDVVRWDTGKASEDLMAACARQGVWKPLERQRGPGAWRGRGGELVLHCGDEIMIVPADGKLTRIVEPGVDRGHVYPAAAPLPRPAEGPAAAGPEGPAARLLEMLSTWAWKRGALDAQLALGWIAAALVGGALHWRPVCWVTGGAGTGKSTFQHLLERLFDEALVHAEDATAAGVWQKLGYATLPVTVDELEPDDSSRKVQDVIKLARLAASGGLVLRGGQSHEGVEFVTRSCFLFSSIFIPPLTTQDRSRICVLELGRMRAAAPPDLDQERMAAIGGGLLRRMVDGWPRLDRTVELYRLALTDAGHTARTADVYGTLLACADIALHDGATETAAAADWAMRLEAGGLSESVTGDTEEMRCLVHLLTSVCDPYRSGGRQSIAEWIERAAGRRPGETLDDQEANRVLQTLGLRVERLRDPLPLDENTELPAGEYLCVANRHQGLSELFHGTPWAAGVWLQALRMLPGHGAPKRSFRFAGVALKATLVPLSVVFAPDPEAGGQTGRAAGEARGDGMSRGGDGMSRGGDDMSGE